MYWFSGRSVILFVPTTQPLVLLLARDIGLLDSSAVNPWPFNSSTLGPLDSSTFPTLPTLNAFTLLRDSLYPFDFDFLLSLFYCFSDSALNISFFEGFLDIFHGLFDNPLNICIFKGPV